MSTDSERENATNVPLYVELPTSERPPAPRTSASEVYMLEMINRGLLLVSTFHAAGGVQQETNVYPPTAPPWAKPETYYDPISDILQAADHAGLDPETLCRQAIDNQRDLRDEAQQEASRLRRSRDDDTSGDLDLTAVLFDQEHEFVVGPQDDWRDCIRQTVCDYVEYEVSMTIPLGSPRTTVTVPPNITVLDIAYAGSTAEGAQAGAAAFADAYLANRTQTAQQATDDEISRVEGIINQVASQLRNVNDELNDTQNPPSSIDRTGLQARRDNINAQDGGSECAADIAAADCGYGWLGHLRSPDTA